MRLFIAALIPEEIKLAINKYVCSIDDALEGVKWESPEKLHITLKFLGDVDTSVYESIREDFLNSKVNLSSFQTTIDQFSAFPNIKNPRVLILKLKENKDFQNLYNTIEKISIKNGFDKDKYSFIPHITIGRAKNSFNAKNHIKKPEKSNFEVNELAIVKSELYPNGSRYSNLDVMQL